MKLTKGDGRIDLQQANGAARVHRDLGLGFGKLIQQFLAAQVEDLAFLGQRQLACGALQQPHPKLGFQFGHPAREP